METGISIQKIPFLELLTSCTRDDVTRPSPFPLLSDFTFDTVMYGMHSNTTKFSQGQRSMVVIMAMDLVVALR